MQLYAPTSTTPKRKAFRAPALASIDGMRIGILENGKLNAEEMLNEVAAAVRPAPRLHRRARSPRRATPARRRPANTLVKVAQEVDFLITGLGD